MPVNNFSCLSAEYCIITWSFDKFFCHKFGQIYSKLIEIEPSKNTGVLSKYRNILPILQKIDLEKISNYNANNKFKYETKLHNISTRNKPVPKAN